MEIRTMEIGTPMVTVGAMVLALVLDDFRTRRGEIATLATLRPLTMYRGKLRGHAHTVIET